MAKDLLQTGDPLPPHAKPAQATREPTPAPPAGAKPVPDQAKQTNNFKLPDKVTTSDTKVEGARRAAMAEGGSKERVPR